MRCTTICVTGATVGLCLITTLAAAAPAKVCIPFDDLQQLHKVSNVSAVATTRRATFMVTFLASCASMSSGAFFVVDRQRVGECLDAGDVLDTSDNNTCTVATVSELPSVSIRTGPK